MNTPQRDMGKHCWDYSLKIQCVSVTIPLGLSQSFLVANREQRAPQPPRAQEPSDTSSWVCMDPQQRFIHSSWEREQSLPRQQPQHC